MSNMIQTHFHFIVHSVQVSSSISVASSLELRTLLTNILVKCRGWLFHSVTPRLKRFHVILKLKVSYFWAHDYEL